MDFGRFQFRPNWWATSATLVGLGLLCSLGFWQLDRAEQKRALRATYEERSTLPPLSLNRVREERSQDELMAGRAMQARGVYDGAFQILLDNQVVAGAVGYLVYTPFRLEHEEVWVLVNRGWVAAGPDRRVVPNVAMGTPGVVVTLRGQARPAPAVGFVLGNPVLEPLAPGTYRIPVIDLARLSEQSGRHLLPYVLELDPAAPDGFMRQWRAPGAGEARHLGYAFQWFALAVALIFIYLFVNLRKEGASPEKVDDRPRQE